MRVIWRNAQLNSHGQTVFSTMATVCRFVRKGFSLFQSKQAFIAFGCIWSVRNSVCKTIVFCVSVAHNACCHQLAELLKLFRGKIHLGLLKTHYPRLRLYSGTATYIDNDSDDNYVSPRCKRGSVYINWYTIRNTL